MNNRLPNQGRGRGSKGYVEVGLDRNGTDVDYSTHLKNNKFSNAVRRQNFAGDADCKAIARWIADGSDKALS